MTGTTISTRISVVGGTLAILLAVLLNAPSSSAAQRRLLRADFPSAMAPLRDGGMLYGELRTGRIWRVDRTGRRARRTIARVRVSARGFAGLLGLAVDPHGRVFAAYTSATAGRLVVDRVVPGRARRIWTGPATASETNGGRLAFTPAGRLLITVGDRLLSLGHGPPGKPFPPWPQFMGSILSLDPNGPRTQIPRVLSSGWFNPYGLAVTSPGVVWAADNAPLGQSDHIARADLGPRPATPTNIGHVAPAGLAAAGNDLYLCGYVTRQLIRYRIERDGHAHQSGAPLAHNCSIGVIPLADGRLAYANEHEIRVLTPQPPHPPKRGQL